jgi:Domain of unknown function (DUF4224)
MSIISLLFLSQDELKELTDLKIPKAQMRWLSKHSYPFEISATGKPKVLRTLIFDRLSKVTNSSNSNEPNFDAIRK